MAMRSVPEGVMLTEMNSATFSSTNNPTSSETPSDSVLDSVRHGSTFVDETGLEENSSITTSINTNSNINSNQKRTKPFLILVSFIAAFSGILFGIDLGGIGASFLMESFRYHFDWSCEHDGDVGCTVSDETIDRDKAFISLFFGLGATVGSLINPYFAERYGRRPCLAVSTLVYILGAALQAGAPVMRVLWLGRFFTGAGIGMLSMVAPIYIAECAPGHARGSLGVLYDFATTTGIVLASAANMGLKEWHAGWKMAYASGTIFAAILFIALVTFMPESPRWLCANASEEELNATLARLRYPEELQAEKANMKEEIQDKQELGEASWREVFSSGNMMRRRVLLGFFFFAIQQLSGGTAVMFYAPDILNTFFTEDGAILGTFFLTIVAFVSTAFTIAVVDRFGRTKLLVYGGSAMAVCLVVLAAFSSMEETVSIGWAILCVSAVFNIAYALSWGPTLYVLSAEIFPYRTRGKATGLTTMSHWLTATLVGAVFPVASSASLVGCFLFFAVCIVVGTSVVYFLQVETNGMTSAQIDEAFLNHKPTFKRKDW